MTGASDFLHHVSQVPGRQELPLLDVDRLPGGGRRNDQIGLATEERGNLQEVQDLRRRAHLRDFMHVGRDRDAQLTADSPQDLQAASEARTPEGTNGSPVGLVVGRLEDEGDAHSGCDLPETAGQIESMPFAFDDAGAGNEKEGLPVPEPRAAEVQPVTHRDFRS